VIIQVERVFVLVTKLYIQLAKVLFFYNIKKYFLLSYFLLKILFFLTQNYVGTKYVTNKEKKHV